MYGRMCLPMEYSSSQRHKVLANVARLWFANMVWKTGRRK